jgi:hypothetical protein
MFVLLELIGTSIEGSMGTHRRIKRAGPGVAGFKQEAFLCDL